MALLVLALLAALAIGWVRGGSIERLGTLPVRSRWLVLAALAAQVTGMLVGGPVHAVGLGVSALLVVAFLARNRTVRGTGLVALGLLANALVVGANGAMPVSAAAAGRAGMSTQALLTGQDPRHELAGEGTRLRWLADVVPVAFPPRPEVVSPGDVLVTAGAAQLVVVGMTRRAAPQTAPAPSMGQQSVGRQPDGRQPVASQPKGRQRRALPPPTGSATSRRRRRRTPPALPTRAPRPDGHPF